MKNEPIRWTLSLASVEFGVSKDTIKRGLNREGIESAETYSTAEIVRSMGGDFRYESTRRQRAEADRLERENRIAAGEIVPIEEADDLYGKMVTALVQRLDSIPSLIPGITLAQKTTLREILESIKADARKVE